jgi:hypothetical protein
MKYKEKLSDSMIYGICIWLASQHHICICSNSTSRPNNVFVKYMQSELEYTIKDDFAKDVRSEFLLNLHPCEKISFGIECNANFHYLLDCEITC